MQKKSSWPLWLMMTVLTLTPADASAWSIGARWTSTKTDGGGNSRGDALTLLWSVVPDGESWSRGGPSDLIDYLDVGWNVAEIDREDDLTDRPWWLMMERVYAQYTRVSGLTMEYVAERDSFGDDTGLDGDIRIGGVPFTWENDKGGVLADNAFPNNGDMRIDTYRGSDGVPSSWHTNNAPFRNLISHESGHGVGLNHDASSGQNFVMETPLNTGFWGLQFDDIYGFNRMYGDPLEKNGGNDSSATATQLGQITLSQRVTLGSDANDFGVGELDDQWLGIDGSTDTDWFEFQTVDSGFFNISLTPLGPSYTTDAQGSVDTSAMADLYFELIDDTGEQVLDLVSSGGLGEAETLTAEYLPAGETFYVRVVSRGDYNQFYELDVRMRQAFTVVEGDFNADGFVDAADYTVWRDNLGADESLISYAGDQSGTVDQGDYAIWLQAYGTSGAAAASTPEPGAASASLFAILLSAAILRRPSIPQRLLGQVTS